MSADMFSYILFDLDGTISDPKEGITGSVQYALRHFGIEEPDRDKLEPFIGPPLRDSFMQFYGFDEQQAEEAIAKYRERFSVTGKYENKLYPGMAELLRDLSLSGAQLAIASSKPTVFVEDILRYFGIRQYFTVVVGSELDGRRGRKEEVVAEVLSQFALRGATSPSDVVMIGDRKFDIEGARAAGTHSIGVSYGYSAPGELEQAGAEMIVRDVEGLRRILLGAQQRGAGEARYRQQDAQYRQDTQYQQGAQYRQQDAQYRQDTQYQQGAQYWQQGTPYWQQGVYSGPGMRYRKAKPETKGKKIAKAIGVSILSMLTYYIAASVAASIVLIPAMIFLNMGNDDTYYFWLNLANAAGITAAFAACFGIWHKEIRVRPRKAVNALSLVPMAVLAAALAMGMNGFLSLIELYKYSPAFQEVSQLQGDIPVWLGILSYGILAPLGEETVFRGIVYGKLKSISNVPIAVILSGLAFGLFHGNLVQAVYATVLGIVLALVYEIYGSILASMLFHGIANLFVYFLLDLTEFGGAFVMPLSCVFFLVVSAVSLVLMLKWQKSGSTES